MSYVILFCILIGHISVDSTAADTKPYMNQPVDGILPMQNGKTSELPSPDGAETQNNWTSSGCKECGHAMHSNKKLIYKGQPVKPSNKYPWVVALTTPGRNNTDCAGAIINEYFILTAAHCIANKRSDEMQIIFLSTENDITKGRRFPVAEVIPHPKWSYGYIYDIGLLKMKDPIQCSAFASPICLPPRNYRHPIGSVMNINGWGKTENSETSAELMEAQMRITKEEKCKHVQPQINPEDMKKHAYCLSGEGKQSSCYGDSGGSMVTKMGNKYYTIGVTHGGDATVPDACNTTVAGVAYSSVSAYMDWITEVTGIVPSELGNSCATTESTSSQAQRKPT